MTQGTNQTNEARDDAKLLAEYFYAKLPDGELKCTAADYLRDGILPAAPTKNQPTPGRKKA